LLDFDLLTSKSNQVVFVPNCTEVVDLAKFKISCYETFSIRSCSTCTCKCKDSPQNGMLPAVFLVAKA